MLLKVTFSEDELAALDAARGQVPRATYVRALVRSATAIREVPAKGTVVRERSLDSGDFQARVEEVSQAGIEAEVSRATGHERGCGCLKCDNARAAI